MKFKMQSLTEVWKESKLYLMGLVALFGIVFGSVFTYQNVIKPVMSTVSINTVRAEEDEDQSYSFYDMTAWLSAYYNAATSPTGYNSLELGNGKIKGKALLTDTAVLGATEAGETDWKLAVDTWVTANKIGGGGSLLGFPDKEVVDGGIIGFLASKTSSSTMDYSYSSLATRELTENQYYNSLETYAYYGASLQSLGIDTNLGGGLMGWHPIRMIGGGLIWIFYIIVSFVEKIFSLAIAILKMTNPFGLFATATSFSWYPKENGFLSGAANFISSTYKIFSNFGWVIMIPVIVSSLIFLMIFTGGGRQNPNLDQRRRSKFRYGIIYFLFLAVGVPFLGTAYTAGLDAMSESVSSGSFSVNSIILSTYVDNKSWIEEERMYLPSSAVIEWDLDDNDVTSTSKASVRRTALAINALTNTDAANAITATDSSNWDLTASTTSNNMSKSISAILLSYMMGNKYEASNWETNVKAYLTKQANNSADVTNNITAGALELTKGYKYLGYVNPNISAEDAENAGVEVDDSWWPFSGTRNVGGTINMFLNKGFNEAGNGGVVAQYDNTSIVRLSAHPDAQENVGFGIPNGNADGSAKATFSYLEMYNYLNSTFTSNKVRVYSTNALASNFTRDSHAEVNQVGSGLIHKFLIWVNTFVMLWGLGILAIGYAFGMIVGSLKRYVDIINSIFLGTLGFQKGMVRATAGTIMLITETLGTLVIYELAKTIYIGVPSIVEGAFAHIGTSGISGSALPTFGFGTMSTNFFGFVSIVFASIFSSLLLAWTSLMLLRIRKPIIDIMDTTFTDIINKLFYGDGQVPGDAPKGVNPPESGGMVGDVAAVGAGLTAGALGSNVDGAEGNDGEDGWSDGGDVSGGEARTDSDFDGPDVRVASSRDTEGTGAEVAETGKLNRSSAGKADDIGDVIGQASADANKDIATGVNSVKSGAEKAVGSAGAVGAMKVLGQSDSEVDYESSVLSMGGLPTSISDDDTLSIGSLSSSPTGGLTPDGIQSATPIGASSLAKSSVEDGDTVTASAQSASGDAQVSAGEHAVAAKDHAVQAGAEAQASAHNISEGATKTVEGASETTQGVGNATAGAGRVMAGDVSGVVQAGQGVVQTVQGAKKTIDGAKQTLKGVEQAASAADHATQSVGHVGSAVTTSVGGQQQSGQVQSQNGTGGQTQRVQAQPTGAVGVQKSPQTNSSGSIRQAGQHLRQAGQSARSGARNVGQGITSATSGVGNMGTGASRIMSGDVGGAKQIASGAKQTVQGVVQTAQGVRQAVNAVNDVGRAGRNIADSNAGRLVGGVAAIPVSMSTSLRDHIVDSTARTWKETATPSGNIQQDANSNYYYDQYDSRKDDNRQTARSYEPRQRQQQERTDARIRRTRRPS